MWQAIKNWWNSLFGKDDPEKPTVDPVTNVVEVKATVVKPAKGDEVKSVALKVSGSYDRETRAIRIKRSKK